MEEFNLRREKLFDLLEDHSIAIIYAGAAKIRSEDENYPFLANRHFFYLTGIEQENSVLLLIKTVGETKTYLFMDEYDERKERWTGKRLAFDTASEISQVSNVYAISNFKSVLDMALKEKVYGEIEHAYFDLSDELKVGPNKSTKTVAEEFKQEYPTIDIIDVYKLITSLRIVKSNLEINNLIEATNITNNGINDLLIHMHLGMYEHVLSDRFEYYGKTHDRRELSFDTIIATGKDATILHHPISQQTKAIESGELILFDLGYKYKGYCADISRTFPVDGVFNEYQKKVYQAVLTTNKQVIKCIRPGLTIADLQEFAKGVLKSEAVKYGLIKDGEDISKYYIHNVSHFLGLDTHDVGDRNTPLVPGNVITVEPGLYFVETGVGVRIEDDVLVTENEAVVLSKGIVKEIADIEKLLKSKRSV